MSKKARVGNIPHDTWVRRMKNMERGEDSLKRPNISTGENLTENKSCFTCAKKRHCKIFLRKRSKEVVSIGNNSEYFICENWTKIQKKEIQTKKVKNLMKEFRRLSGS